MSYCTSKKSRPLFIQQVTLLYKMGHTEYQSGNQGWPNCDYTLDLIKKRQEMFKYWVSQKLPQICTVILRICIGKVACFSVYNFGNFWVTQYLLLSISVFLLPQLTISVFFLLFYTVLILFSHDFIFYFPFSFGYRSLSLRSTLSLSLSLSLSYPPGLFLCYEARLSLA